MAPRELRGAVPGFWRAANAGALAERTNVVQELARPASGLMRGKGSLSVVQRELTKEKALLISPQGPLAASKSDF